MSQNQYSKTSENSFVLVGKVHSAQGLRGDIFVSIFAEEAQWADQWETLHLTTADNSIPMKSYKIMSKRTHKKQNRWGFVVCLDEISDRDQSEALKGMSVMIPEEYLVSEEGDEIYLREVLGFEVVDQSRGSVGVVKGFSGNSMQDLLVIEGEKGTFEVPFVEPLLVETDKKNKKLIMDIPQGLVAGEEL